MSKTLKLNLLVRRIGSLTFCSPTSSSPIPFPPKLFLSSYSSQAHSPAQPIQPAAEQTNPTPSNDDLPPDVSTQELKQRIDKYLQGDLEAIPSIFEAILARKLSGNHDDSDDEIMGKFRSNAPHSDDNDEDESDESDEVFSETDEELSG